VEAAATGPKVIAAAARHADRILLAVGAEPARLQWGIDEARRARSEAGLDPAGLAFGAYVNLVCHPKVEAARALVSGGLATFARFSVMHGHSAGPLTSEEREVLAGLHAAYDMKHHTRSDSRQADVLTPAFTDRFAIVGEPEHCLARLEEIAALGIEKLVLVGPTVGGDPAEAQVSAAMLEKHILSAHPPPAPPAPTSGERR
jgi:5,10-methylenetetrahydromethanopterin reductase